jgi:hypothetical protein
MNLDVVRIRDSVDEITQRRAGDEGMRCEAFAVRAAGLA